tara:strand:- start:150 stop:1793 length:1644 start_codon:yes stop_codon:yes gene_type:complete
MNLSSDLISARREFVLQSYNSAKAENNLRFLEGDYKSTAEYIFPNQIQDANNITNMFYNQKVRVISIQKLTKLGADGLMIEIAKLLTTHIDDNFVVDPSNVRIITGMSNVCWQKDMIDKAPNCFKDKIFHHGKLKNANLNVINNGLIIIDEIDTGDKEKQVLDTILKEARILDVEHMKMHNNKFVIISATMIKELYDLYRWGKLHIMYNMIIPSNYIGHKDFLDMKIINEYYPLDNENNIKKWIEEDILNNYKTDYRIHIVRITYKMTDKIKKTCIDKNIIFKEHNSEDRLSDNEMKTLFTEPLTQHTVLGVKGFLRRANLIPNIWKLRIGTIFEYYTQNVDYNVQIQGLTGRMTGYWRDTIINGHKTGPYRTSIKAIEAYEKIYNDPFGTNSYKTNGFNKKEGKFVTTSTCLNHKNANIKNPVDLPISYEIGSTPIIKFTITIEEKENIQEIIKTKDTKKITKIVHKIMCKYTKDIFEKYKLYKLRCWNIDPNDKTKCDKYGLNLMCKDNAYSLKTNIKDKTQNILMVYLYENQLIINAWNGEITI